MFLSEKSVFRLTVFIPVISVIFLSSLLTYFIISYQHDFLDKEFNEEKKSYINSQKALIQNEVNKVFELIKYKDKISQLRLQKKIKIEMDSYFKVVSSIYEQNKNKKSKTQILEIIKSTLRDVRLDTESGYLNIFDTSGIAILLPIQEHYEDMSIINFRDYTNNFYIKEAINIAKKNKVGFFSNYEVKPDVEQDKEFYKLNYIKLFEPLGIVLSVGDFLSNIDTMIKSEILNRVNEIRFGKKGYVYIVNMDGKLIAHRDKNLIGIDAFSIKDINGKYYFKEGFNKAKKFSESYIEYVSRTNKNSNSMYNAKKLSFAKYNSYYGWVISAGVYIDDIENVIAAKKKQNSDKFKEFTYFIISIAVLLTIIVIIISFGLAVSIRKMFINYKTKVEAKEIELHKINSSLEERITTELLKSRKKDAQLISQARFASLGEMIGNIAHQWRQPLSAISTISSGNILQSELGLLSNEENKKSYSDILKHVTFLSQTIDDFRNYLNNKSDDKAQFNVNDTVNNILKIIEIAYKDNNISLQMDLTEQTMHLYGSSSEFSQVILNVLNNAKDVLCEKEVEQKVVKISTFKLKDKMIIKIYDNAGGVPSDIIEKIFDPYFTTKHQSQGTGIGLYMSKDIIVKKYNGMLDVENVDWKYENQIFHGACFTIEL